MQPAPTRDANRATAMPLARTALCITSPVYTGDGRARPVEDGHEDKRQARAYLACDQHAPPPQCVQRHDGREHSQGPANCEQKHAGVSQGLTHVLGHDCVRVGHDHSDAGEKLQGEDADTHEETPPQHRVFRPQGV
eukprot:CAMPEP_0175792838 /NCGR_PEP_ID=MMETSP0097-20121207/83166_1 /TAXON_ID=311494 /ORGANISM="Alexandrium monilatum, Strain CCMP3105" /LENGTH=135 /DNA_ID=CAMNT_0017104025 /DNA_START=21 /DNA_END=426 /DNA_ORIENTATION=+